MGKPERLLVALVLAVDQALQCSSVQNAHVALFYLNHAFFHKFGEGAADGFKLQTQVTANFFACHA